MYYYKNIAANKTPFNVMHSLLQGLDTPTCLYVCMTIN